MHRLTLMLLTEHPLTVYECVTHNKYISYFFHSNKIIVIMLKVESQCGICLLWSRDHNWLFLADFLTTIACNKYLLLPVATISECY